MNILLGNLSIEEIENRVQITFPEMLKTFMKTRQQENTDSIKPEKWHCFDIPFTLVCGDVKTAKEIFKHLQPLSKSFKNKMEISIQK